MIRRILPFLLRLARAIIIPRRSAVMAEARNERLAKAWVDDRLQQNERIEQLSENFRSTADLVGFWKVEAEERTKESEAASLALKLCREELSAAHVQIDATAKIIHALNEQRMMDARIAATRAQGPPSNADLLGRVLD